MTKPKTYISVQLPPEIAAAIKTQAREELISVAAVVRRILAEYVRLKALKEDAR